MTTAVQNIQSVVIRWMYWDCRRKSTPYSVPLAVILPFQHSGCQHKPQRSVGGQQSGRGRSAVIPTFHGNNLQGLRIMNIELKTIWPDLGVGLLFRHFDMLGSYCSLQLQAVSSDARPLYSLCARLRTAGSGVGSLLLCLGFAHVRECNDGACILRQRKKSQGLRGWRHLMLLTPCLPFRPSPKPLSLLKVITYNICVKRMVRLEGNTGMCVGGGLQQAGC